MLLSFSISIIWRRQRTRSRMSLVTSRKHNGPDPSRNGSRLSWTSKHSPLLGWLYMRIQVVILQVGERVPMRAVDQCELQRLRERVFGQSYLCRALDNLDRRLEKPR